MRLKALKVVVIGNMKNRIAFFGASVTQQRNGYWKYFADNHKNFDVASFGYGSRHLNDAGVCYIDTVLDFEPDYCFIDWFSTGYIKYNEDKFYEIKEYINTIIHKFYSKGVKLIFLTFPDETVDKTEIYVKINNYLKEQGIPVIDISKSFNDLKVILRDGIHTTDFGSSEYSRIISDIFFNEIYEKHSIPSTYVGKNKFCDIKMLELNIVATEKIVLNGPCEVIGISQYIGPYTGLVKIDDKIFNNWDRWCHYEREMVNLKFNVNDTTVIEVLGDDFDRSACEYKNVWNVNKCLKLLTAFYIGEQLVLKEYN